MFRPKISSILRNIANSSYQQEYINFLPCSLFSTECVNVESIKKPPADNLYKKIELEVKGNEPAVLRSYGEFIVMAAEHLEIKSGRNIALPKPVHEKLTVLKSVHIYKKHRVQYERRTYFRYLDFYHLTGSTADTFLEYIERNLPEGVAMKVTKIQLQTLPESVEQAKVSEEKQN
ncbi:mitochondrial ribosomal protein S10 [Nomia melanderi]|uniref:mitochondrial ribosomal protein S10 n=1 Tax=Nomia melanderi TaxID=2448451 RepID=UPI0013044F1A|nr:28S ribosomal protein S10, mitochondrial [Nomia melanderi]